MAGAVATLDSTACTSVTVASATQITCTTAAHTSGAVTVAVTNTEAQSGTLANAFSYSTIIGVATAWTSSWVMYANGSLKYWGNGYYYGGQTAITPLEFITSGVTSISCVGYSDGCCAVISGGVKCWGVNQYKNIGDGGSSNSATPVTATGLTSGVSAIRAGAYSVCANLSNGTAKCWDQTQADSLETVLRPIAPHPRMLADLQVAQPLPWPENISCFIVNGEWQCAGLVPGNNSNSPVAITGYSTGVTSVAPGTSHICSVIRRRLLRGK